MVNLSRIWGYLNGNAQDGNVKHYNWWDNQSSWFSEFINFNFPHINREQHKFCIYSVFGPMFLIKFPKLNKKLHKIFFTGEDVHSRRQFLTYNDLALSYVDLSMGFDYSVNSDNKYIRFPIWILYLFSPHDTEEDISRKIQDINSCYSKNKKQKDCALIARWCPNGLRTEIYSALSKFMSIECPSILFHNTDELKSKFMDNKIEYLRQFRFNICPENATVEGYVTEKIFEAFKAGCIPIYSGAKNNPEPGIINKNSYILWDNKKEAIKRINFLNQNYEAYEEFISQDRLLPYSVEYVCERFSLFKKKLSMMLQ